MSLILCILLGFVLWWIIRIATGIQRARNQFRQFFNQTTGSFSTREQTNAERKGGWSAPRLRKKKIDPTVGEYIRFTETDVKITSTEANDHASASHKSTVEEQITDVDWEEIPR